MIEERLKWESLSTKEQVELNKVCIMFTQGNNRRRFHIPFKSYEYDTIYTCQCYMRNLSDSVIPSLIKKYSVILRLVDNPSEEMIQLHKMIWEI